MGSRKINVKQSAAKSGQTVPKASGRYCITTINILYSPMQYESNKLYHLYNQGNNKQQLFFSDDNYAYFLRAYEKLVSPYCDTLAYCLMPNHFHFMIHQNPLTAGLVKRWMIGTTLLLKITPEKELEPYVIKIWHMNCLM